MQPVRQYGAAHLRTSAATIAIAEGSKQSIAGTDHGRLSVTIDNEGTNDLFVSEDEGGTLLTGGGGVRVAAGGSRTLLVVCPLLVFRPSDGNGAGAYRIAIETDS